MNGDQVTGETEFLRERVAQLKANRSVWESHWQEIADYIEPRKTGFTGRVTAGEKRTARIYDNTGGHALELLAGGLHGMATSPASRWFSLRVTDDDLNEVEEVKLYLAEVEKRMWAAMYAPGTNFATALHELYLDMGGFGTGVMYIGQRMSGSLLFQACGLSETLIDENAEGTVDTVMRCRTYTTRQLVQVKGWTPSERVRKAYDAKRYDEPVTVVHAVYPRADRDPTRRDRANMPFASVYFEQNTAHQLEASGYPEMPYATPRWAKVTDELYGRCPGMTALPDVKMLQQMMRTLIVSAQKSADPPTFLPDDSVVGPVRLIPGGISYYRGQREIFQLQPPNTLPVTLEILERQRELIRSTFYVDVMQTAQTQDMTATEATYRQQEKMRLMGPMLGRLEAELLGVIIARVYGMLNRLGKLPEMPEALSEKQWTIEYVSPLATAQKQQQAQGIMSALQIFGGLGPEIAGPVLQRRLSGERMLEYLWDLFNNDPKLLAEPDEEATAANTQATQQAVGIGQPAAQMLDKGAGALKKLAEANAGGGVDLGALMGAMGQDPRAQQASQALSDGMQDTAENMQAAE
jgi:hypothetical protein